MILSFFIIGNIAINFNETIEIPTSEEQKDILQLNSQYQQNAW